MRGLRLQTVFLNVTEVGSDLIGRGKGLQVGAPTVMDSGWTVMDNDFQLKLPVSECFHAF